MAGLEFGPFLFDAAAGLFRGRQPVPLGQRALALLALLTERSGRAVSKDELMERAWPGVVVEETNLSVQIAALRKTLADGANGRAWIVTVPRYGYRFQLPAEAEPAQRSPLPTLIVMPFERPIDHAEARQLADGIAADITDALSRFRAFCVITQSAAALSAVEPDEGVASNGARYVLSGSVRPAAGQVRVSVALTEAASGARRWGEKFDGDLSALFAFHDRVSEVVAALVEPEILRAEVERARRRPATSRDAYELYLRALPLFRTSADPERSDAVRLLEEATALDPHFGPALVHAAWAYERHDTFGPGLDDASRDRALDFARRALAASPDDPLVTAIAALVLLNVGMERERSLAMLAQAIKANPNHPTILSLHAFANVMVGDVELGRLAFLKALGMTSSVAQSYEALVGVGMAQLMAGDFADAADWGLKGIAANGEWLGGHWLLCAARAHQGRTEDAARAVAALRKLAPAMTMAHMERIGLRYARRIDIFTNGLRLAGMPD